LVVAFVEQSVPLEDARVVVLPVPYEGTVSYGAGTARGPAAILAASGQVELYDEQFGFEPFRVGVHTDATLDVTDAPSAREVAHRVEVRVGELMDLGKWVVMLGGEHSITPGGVRAAAGRHPGLRVVQLDAHADLRESYEGDPWSHACATARCLDVAPVLAVGIRSYSVEEARRLDDGIPGHHLMHAWEMDDPGWIGRAIESIESAPVYLTVDVDYFDPAVVPVTGTPEPGGGRWWPTLRFLEAVFERGPVVAADVVELAPVEGLHHADFTVARLVYKLIGLFGGGRAGVGAGPAGPP
jgi:agmatinase